MKKGKELKNGLGSGYWVLGTISPSNISRSVKLLSFCKIPDFLKSYHLVFLKFF